MVCINHYSYHVIDACILRVSEGMYIASYILSFIVHVLYLNAGFFVFYGCATYNGSSGSPVLKVVDGALRVVALHRACAEINLNYGSLFQQCYPIVV